MSGNEEPGRHITETEYREWLERARPRLAAELTAALPQEARDAGMRIEWKSDQEADEVRDVAGYVLSNAVRAAAGVIGFPVLPCWPDGTPWAPFRNVFPRWRSGKACYPLPSGNMVHIKPGCRCLR